MTKFTSRCIVLLSAVLFFWACQKEVSKEGTGLGGIAQGSLTDVSGVCKNAEVKGDYVIDQDLTADNYVMVEVDFTLQGKYKIYSDTVNGMWFIDSGFALTTGPTTVKLKGYGKPILPNTADFVFTFNNSFCAFSVTTSITGGSGGTNNDYFPNTLNSNWTYEYIPKMGTVDNFKATVTAKSVFFDNKVFKEFSTESLGIAYYFSKDNAGNYYALSTTEFDYMFVFDEIPNTFISYPFLKDNVAVGTTWESAEYGKVKVGSEVGVSKAVFTIMGKGISYSVLGTNYPDVISVKRNIQFKPDGGSYRSLIEGTSYYAKGVGLIDQVVPAANQSVSLKAKQIF